MPRVVIWTVHLLLPLAGLWLLLEQPSIDVKWHDSASHFWLVLIVSLINMGLGMKIQATAARRDDGRLLLVSFAFLISAGFFALHALATPGVLVHHANVGFDAALPVGLAVSAPFALASSLPLNDSFNRVVLRTKLPVQILLGLLIVGWAVVSVRDLPPLNATPGPREVDGPLTFVAIATIAIYLIAAWRFYLMHRRRPAAVTISIITAFVLLAEAIVTVMVSHRWALSWWEWHLLLAFAFGFVAYSAYVQYGREGTSAGLFDAISRDQTVRAIEAEYSAALEEVVTALEDGRRPRLPERVGLTEGQMAVLDRAAQALSAERAVSRKLSTLFHHYLSPDVAAALIADPEQAGLGGSLVEVTALFADHRGFTTFSEAVHPAAIVEMLNRYHAVTVPCVLDNGGTVIQFQGDALLALFNAPARQPDHALRAVRAALQMQHAVEAIARQRGDWPRFRAGANTGPAVVGNIGSEQLRGFNAMGDAVNVAARLQTLAEPGQVIVGEETLRGTHGLINAQPLGDLQVKGRVQPVRAYIVKGMQQA